MTRSSSQDRLKRLESITAQLKQDAHFTVQQLAEIHGVSDRTITRDLLILREQGLPIDADRGRGGGVRLDRRWGVGRLNLGYAESVDLLISLAVAEQMASPLFLANLGSVRRQLVASFSPERRGKVEKLKSRILIGRTASTVVQSNIEQASNRNVQALHQAFVDQKQLRIHYQTEGGAQTWRDIEPHYLLLNYPVWYVIAFDHLRNSARTFRVDRIVKTEPSETRFKLRPETKFQASLEGNEDVI